jgi:nucleoside-diphosphate-sugar epimerase
MRVFVTGASGWIGSATVDELLAAGHEVTGLARSDESAAAITAKGAHVHRGDLDDLDSIRTGAAQAEAVVHLANKHDWADRAGTIATQRAAARTIGDTLAGTGRPFLIASGVAGLTPGRPATEDDTSMLGADSPGGGVENLVFEYLSQGVHAVSLRFSPTVHGTDDHGFIGTIATIAREKGMSGYPGDGSNRWAAVHRDDAARMAAQGLAKAPAGARLHAVAEEGVSIREIAEAIGRSFDLPVKSIPAEDVASHFGWIGAFWAMDLRATSTKTRDLLGWAPTARALIEDIDAGAYSKR